MTENSVEIIGLCKSFVRPEQGSIAICKNLNLKLKKGKIYSIIGTSGSGKTTLINMIAGFENYDSGAVVLDGGNKAYKVGILFQDSVLYPWKTIMDNMLFACKNDFENPKELVRAFLRKAGLEEVENCYPNELSGGMQQRIALLRVLLTKPDLVILDEAFGALDFQIRNQMQELFLELHSEQKFTAIVVTHDLTEAIRLGDEVLAFYGRPLEYEVLNSNITSEENKENLLEKINKIYSYRKEYIYEKRVLQNSSRVGVWRESRI